MMVSHDRCAIRWNSRNSHGSSLIAQAEGSINDEPRSVLRQGKVRMFNRYWIKHVQPVIHWFTQAVTEPRSQLDRTERFVRYTYELGVHGWVALRRDNAPQMAAALSFRTL